MTVEHPFSLAQLAQILSALENERRNPNTKRNAIKAIARNAAQIGLSAEDVFDAADGLLSGRMNASEFRAALRDECCGPATHIIEAPADESGSDEPAEVYLMPNAGPLAVARSSTGGTGDDDATDVAAAAEDAPVAATATVGPATTETRVGAKQQLLAACQAAEHWLQAELDRPGETQPDEILRVLRAAIERAEGERKPRQPRRPGQPRQSRQGPRESSKEAMLIEMLRRPEGATIAQIMAATGWQAHTCRGALAGALKKKRGLTVTSEKGDDGVRVYRIAG
jgi:Protein of unknown function (DUF3489)